VQAPTPAPSPTPFPPVEGLRDIAMPEAVSLWPPAPGWWVVLALLLLVAFWIWRRYERARAAGRYRREALAELEALASGLGRQGGRAALAERLPALLKRVALHVEPRPEVAALTGAEWLAELDRMYHGAGFASGPGRNLPVLSYGTSTQVEALPQPDLDALVALCRDWIGGHHAAPAAARGPRAGEEAKAA
jgi:hypothetical protein